MSALQNLKARLHEPTYIWRFLENRYRDDDDRTIHYVNALCGSGKTFQALSLAVARACQFKNTILVVPTIRLGTQILKTEVSQLSISAENQRHLRQLFGRRLETAPARKLTFVHRIDGKNRSGHISTPVQQEIMSYLSKRHSGEILIITHSALRRMMKNPTPGDWRSKLKDWLIIIDESFKLVSSRQRNLAETANFLIPHLGEHPYPLREYCVIRPTKDGLESVQYRAKNKLGDTQVGQSLKGIAGDLCARNVTNLANAEAWKRLKSGEQSDLIIHSILKPDLLFECEMCIMMCANFKDNLAPLLLSKAPYFVNFRPFLDIQQKLLSQEKHEIQGKISVYYLTERRWSKTRAERLYRGKLVIEHFMDGCLKIPELQEQPFLYLANKDGLGFSQSNAIQLPSASEGLNSYRDVHHCVALAAYNPTPSQIRLCEHHGLTSEQIDVAIFGQRSYQALTRTSARVLGDSNLHLFVVPTLAHALYIASKFQNVEIRQLDTCIKDLDRDEAGNQPVGESVPGSERTQISRNRKKVAELLQHHNVPACHIDDLLRTTMNIRRRMNERSLKDPFAHFCNASPKIIRSNVTDFDAGASSIHSLCTCCAVVPWSIADITYTQFVGMRGRENISTEILSWQQFCQKLSISRFLARSSKTTAPRFSTATFRDSKTTQGGICRSAKNCTESQVLLFTVNGVIDFSELPRHLKGVEAFCFELNSKESAYRILIPLGYPVPAHFYTAIWKSVLNLLQKIFGGKATKGEGCKPNWCVCLPQQIEERTCDILWNEGLPLNPIYFLMRNKLK
jgi:hypothetical protein